MTARVSRSSLRLAQAAVVIAVFAVAFPIAARAAVTERDLATLNTTTTVLNIQAGAPGEISLPWVLGRMAIALGVVFGLMAVVIWAARRYLPQASRAGRGGPIEVLTTRSLGQRRSLMLVRVQGRTLLLGVTPQSIQTLTELDGEAGAANWPDAAVEAGLPNTE